MMRGVVYVEQLRFYKCRERERAILKTQHKTIHEKCLSHLLKCQILFSFHNNNNDNKGIINLIA